MQWKQIHVAVPMMAALVLGACGDESGPGGDLSESEQQALVTALAQGGALGVNFAAPLALTTGLAQDAEIGTLGSMSAWGGQALVSLDYPGTEDDVTLTFTSVTGWSNLNAGNQTVDNAVWATVITEGGFPSSINEAVMGTDQAFGGYWERSTSSQYWANTGEGQFTLATASFNSANDCDDLPDLGNGISITECSFAIGTITGDFDFVADKITGTGVETFTQPNIAFDVPAVRLTITFAVEASPAE
jgi:hypothetical protein